MSRNGNYIKLPSLISIEVNDYTLFKKSWSYHVKNGLNLFLGINELGKTTTANMIIYGLVGLYEDITPRYFKLRAHADGKVEPTVALTFKIGNDSLYIKRKLFSRTIDSFKVGKQQYTGQDTVNIDQIYNDTFLRLTGVCEIEDLSFLLKYLLIREEEGNFLLWNQETQSVMYWGQLTTHRLREELPLRGTSYFRKQLSRGMDSPFGVIAIFGFIWR